MSYESELAALRDVDQKRVNSLLEKLQLTDQQILDLINAIAVARDRGEHWDWMRGAPAAGDKFIHWCQFILNIKDEDLDEELLTCRKPKIAKYKSSIGVDPNVQAVLDHNTSVIDKFMDSIQGMVEMNKKAYQDGYINGREDVLSGYNQSPDLLNFPTTVDAGVDVTKDVAEDAAQDTSDDAAEDTAKDMTADGCNKKRKRQNNRRTRF